MIDFRLTDGFSFAVPFAAADAVEFVAAGSAALSEFRRRAPAAAAQLHVRVANGDWIAPTYRLGRSAVDPDGNRILPNTPICVGASVEPWLFAFAAEGKRDGDRFAGQFEALKDFASRK